jgi:hypothetical protein
MWYWYYESTEEELIEDRQKIHRRNGENERRAC